MAEDYWGGHRPGSPEFGAPAHDLTHNGMYPDDVYTHMHLYDFGGDHNSRRSRETRELLHRIRGNPDAKVTMYRSLPPEHADKGFRPGDWVSLHHDYAKQHGVHPTDPSKDWPVIHAEVPAKHLWTNADSLDEFGYYGPPKKTAAIHVAGIVDDYRVEREAQDRRFENWARGGISARDTHAPEYKQYFGQGEFEGSGVETRHNFKNWLQTHKGPEEGGAEERAYWEGHDLGSRHGEDPDHADFDAADRLMKEHPHAAHVTRGYMDGFKSMKHTWGDSRVAMYTTRPYTLEERAQEQERKRQHENALVGHRVGQEMGARHARDGYDSVEFDRAAIKYGPFETKVWVRPGPWIERNPKLVQQPRSFFHGYDQAYSENGGTEKTGKVAVLRNPDGTPRSGIAVVAHVSGNQIDILHCPFCGSGAVIGRSDGTVECGYCTSVFTVQTQPQYNGFPQSVNGQPYQWPGMPDPGSVAAPDMPEGTNLNPNTNGENDVVGGPPTGLQSSDPADADGDDGEDDDDKPAFLKGKGDKSDKGDDKKKDSKDKGNPFSKKTYRTASGAVLDEENYLAHLAIQFANDKARVARLVKAARKG